MSWTHLTRVGCFDWVIKGGVLGEKLICILMKKVDQAKTVNS